MKIDVKKIKIKDLENSQMPGNYLYKDEKYYYFSVNKYHNLFIVNKSLNTFDNEYGSLFLKFEQWQFDLFDICSKVSNSPSFLFYNSNTSPDEIKKHLGEKYTDILEVKDIEKINDSKPSLHWLFEDSKFEDVFEKIMEKRDFMTSNDLFVILDSPEEDFIKNLTTYITLARSRKIYFIILVASKDLFIEKYSSEELDIIESNCPIRFICNNDEIIELKVAHSIVKGNRRQGFTTIQDFDTIKIKN